MNGDLSLSQSLGGLRIANPDDDDVKAAQHHPPDNSHQGNGPDSLSQRPPQSSTGLAQHPRPLHDQGPPEIDQHGQLDVTSSLGFDPTAYAFNPQPSPTASSLAQFPPQPAPAPRHPSSRKSVQHPQQPLSANSSATRYPAGRPYQPGNPHFPPNARSQPTTPASTQENSYQRVRAESTQSANMDLRRSNSRSGTAAAAAAAAMQAGVARGPSSSQPPQMAPPGQSSSGYYPPRRSSRPQFPHQSDSYNMSRAGSEPLSASSQPDVSPLASSSEEWQERGAAVQVRQVVDQNGRPTTRVTKKGVKDFSFGRTLGEGSYSTVLAATDRTTQREYAIKVLDKRHIIKEKKVKYVNIEKDTLNRLTDHPGVVRLYYTFQDERSLYFVLDLATGGELLGVLKKTTSFDEECSRFYAAQILDAIEYMHLRGIIHRDLKPENVLLDDQMHVKITDFGTAKILDIGGTNSFGQVSVSNDPMDGADTDRAVSFVGTAEYVSPELLTDKNACKASDLWAFGCIVYQLLAGRPPFKAGNEYQTFQKIVNLDYSFPDGFPPVARDLVEKLLVLNPAERLPIGGIKRHPFFNGIEWGKGLWKQKPPRLRPYNPYRAENNGLSAASRSSQKDSISQPSSKPSISKQISSSTSSSQPPGTRPLPRLITELAPPSQLDIDWSPVLNRPNERILKLGNLIVYSVPAPHSPTSKGGPSSDTPSEAPSKLSRFFGGTATKKRQRLVMVSSAARLILAPSGGEKKEAKQVIDLRDQDVVCRSQQDAKGYTVLSVMTRDRHLTFEDSKVNTGDFGSSVRSTQEWLDVIESAKDFATSQSVATSYSDDSAFNNMTPSNHSASIDPDAGVGSEGGAHAHRNVLRRGQASGDDDSLKGRRRFSKRVSKNGLAAVF